MTTIHISEETHLALRKIKGKLLAENRKERTFDEGISILIERYKLNAQC